MEKVITHEITKYLLVLGAGVVALSVIFARMITKVRGAFGPYRKATLVYSLAALFFFAIIAVFSHPAFAWSPISLLLFFQAYFLMLGITHIFLSRQNLLWTAGDTSLLPELLFTLIICFLGCMGFLIVSRIFNRNGMEYMMAGSIIFFVVPLLLVRTFKTAIAIPPKIIKAWFYPIQEDIDEPEDSKLKNLLVISFEFQKQATDTNATNFRAKAPSEMEFGELFYYFINDYNERHPNSKVQYVNATGEPHGWVFYKRPKWHTVITQYIDAGRTISNNKIKENDVIICTRSLS